MADAMVSPKEQKRDYNILITENALQNSDLEDKNTNKNNTMYLRTYKKSITTTKSDYKIKQPMYDVTSKEA